MDVKDKEALRYLRDCRRLQRELDAMLDETLAYLNRFVLNGGKLRFKDVRKAVTRLSTESRFSRAGAQRALSATDRGSVRWFG